MQKAIIGGKMSSQFGSFNRKSDFYYHEKNDSEYDYNTTGAWTKKMSSQPVNLCIITSNDKIKNDSRHMIIWFGLLILVDKTFRHPTNSSQLFLSSIEF